MTNEEIQLFWDYFNIADEVSGGLTLDQLDSTTVNRAEQAANRFSLSWPPSLSEAEDFVLDHTEVRTV